MPILMKNVRVQGIFVGCREMFEAMNRAIALHQLRPVVDRVFAFADAVEALSTWRAGAHFGKVVIRPCRHRPDREGGRPSRPACSTPSLTVGPATVAPIRTTYGQSQSRSSGSSMSWA